MIPKLGAAAIVGALTLAATPTAAASTATPLDRAMSSTVIVASSHGHGAGIHLGEGKVLTAAHVADQAVLRLSDSHDESIGTGRVVAQDTVRDLALIQVDSSDAASELGTSTLRTDAAHVGETVYAAGAPGEEYIQLSAGIVSAVVEQGSVTRVQTDAPVNPGNSGGPLLDEDGQVIGIVVTKSATDEGIGWATSASEAVEFLSEAPDSVGSTDGGDASERGAEAPARGTQLAPLGALGGVTALGVGALAWAMSKRRRRQPPLLDLSDLSSVADMSDRAG